MEIVLFILFFFLAIIFLLFSIQYTSSPDKKTGYTGIWGVFFLFGSIILWYMLGAAVMELEYPWEIFNVTSGNVETGVHVFTSEVSIYLSYFFQGIAGIFLILIVGFGGSIIHDKLQELGIIKKGRRR